MNNLEQNIKLSFSKVKEDILSIKNELKLLEENLKSQKEETSQILPKINEISRFLEELKSKVSTGNEGVNQSINHSINQSITNQSISQSQNDEKELKMRLNRDISQPNDIFNIEKEPSNQSITNQSINHLITQSQNPIRLASENINKVFLSLTKQELKLFLTIYQLEDEGVDVTYRNLSLRMQLSEHCIRSHVSSLLKKNTPLAKSHFHNKINKFSIPIEFKALNLKNKLINMYYDSDPHQKTLLDI